MISAEIWFLYLIKKKTETLGFILLLKELHAIIVFSGQEIGKGLPQRLSNLSEVVLHMLTSFKKTKTRHLIENFLLSPFIKEFISYLIHL